MKKTDTKFLEFIARRLDVRPPDLRPGESYEVHVTRDESDDGLRFEAARCLGFGPRAFFRSEDLFIDGGKLQRASLQGDVSLVNFIERELEHLARRMQLALRPPKGWRLFGRRPVTVCA